MDREYLLNLLSYISPSSLEYQEWVNVGMALKHEGYACSDWDAWSQPDPRYKAGDCEKKWKTFKEGTTNIVTGGTIYDMAVKNGYNPVKREIRTFGWNDEIEYDGNDDVLIKDMAWLDVSETIKEPSVMNGPDELRRYIQALFQPEEYVGFCTESEYNKEKDKWQPASKGTYGFTAKYLLNQIKKHPDDMTKVIGDYEEKSGAWIRFNPLDGNGVSNNNVTDLRYALVESDNLEIEKQKKLMEELKLPIAIMVYSGAKSVHAIVRINAITEQEYREKVDYLYEVCEKNGLSIDKQNKNQSRLSRMPGVMRNGKKQFIIAENIGCASFEEWKNYIEESQDNFPDIITYSELKELPDLSPELIEGVLRQGHKMLVSGASKAGKSFLLIELALSIAEGRKWLGFQCLQGKVLYINLEVDGNSFLHRIDNVRAAMGIEKVSPNLEIWNLRGNNAAIEKLAPKLIRRATGKGYSAIVFDPLYKINEGNENDASEMARFFNYLDMICVQLKTSIICCHHHSKGSQGGKFSMDRASGSGVFARDPDALLDMIRLNPADCGKSLEPGTTAWRISSTLREFQAPDDIDVIFDYPIHKITEELKDAKPLNGADSSTNSRRGNAVKSENKAKKIERLIYVLDNWSEIDTKNPPSKYPTTKEIAEYFKSDKGFSEKSIRSWIKENNLGTIQNGMVIPNDEE